MALLDCNYETLGNANFIILHNALDISQDAPLEHDS